MQSPKVKAGPMQFAEKSPGEYRLAMFQRLAKLKMNGDRARKTFDHWYEKQDPKPEEAIAWKSWLACWDETKVESMFSCIQTAAVLDESFRLPTLSAGTEGFRMNVEQKFSSLMQRISLLALTIQRDQEEMQPRGVESDASSNSDSQRNAS